MPDEQLKFVIETLRQYRGKYITAVTAMDNLLYQLESLVTPTENP